MAEEKTRGSGAQLPAEIAVSAKAETTKHTATAPADTRCPKANAMPNWDARSSPGAADGAEGSTAKAAGTLGLHESAVPGKTADVSEPATALARTDVAAPPAARAALGRALVGTAQILSALAIAALCVALIEAVRISTSESGGLRQNFHLLMPLAIGITVAAFAQMILTVRALTNRLSVAVLTCVPLTFGLLIAHVKKMDALGKPLVPADLGLVGELVGVLQSVIAGQEFQFAAMALASLLLIAAIAYCLVTKPRFSMQLGERAAILCVSAALLGSELASGWLMPALEKIGVENIVWSYGYNLRKNGFLLPFLMNARQVLPRPKDYSAPRIAEIFEALPEQDCQVQSPAISEKPDVVVYMAEAFWDVTKLGVQFNRDPIPNFHALAASHQLFSMTSPQRGGGTANVEFEMLTGIPHALLPPSSVPYQHYIHRPLRALPALFREQGYTTAALHNFHRYYYSRASVYPLFGFERFIALDELEPVDLNGRRPENGFVNNKGIATLSGVEALIDGEFPSDEPLVRRILEELDAEGKAPRFLFAIGMVGHGPFLYKRWPEPDVTVAAGQGKPPLTEEVEHDLENMSNAAFRADTALGFLVRALEKRARPTILVFFGDHLPALRPGTFAATKFDEGEYSHRRFETQVLFWSNRPLPEIDARPAFSVFYLSPKILEAAGLPLPRYLSLLKTFEPELAAMNDALLQTGSGRWFSGPRDVRAPANVQKIVGDLSVLAYDRLAGARLSDAL